MSAPAIAAPRKGLADKAILLHVGVLALLLAAQFVLPEYHALSLTRVMLLATFAVGYNLLFGYTGLLSLGHALFFAAGLYGAALPAYHFGWTAPPAFLAGIAAGFLVALTVGAVALRTTGVAFMIVTLMFAQAGYLATLYFGNVTRGDEGLVLTDAVRRFELLGLTVDLADPGLRYNLALALLAAAIAITLVVVRRPIGRVLVAIRENEARTLMLGYDSYRAKLVAVVLSGTISAAAGAAYALLFAYAGSSFASIHYSIYPLLWTLLGGAATVLGPVLGTLIMFYLIDLASGFTTAHLVVVGLVLVALVLFFPKGILGTVRERWLPWLP
ncbi:branched-chain amino acid ABC transporter permease [Methylobrevis albus]|uniref:Branched-chain amino acid ABC transporter permease n=1 Tax=Methylobrevis albus TaxID=2793297 RepID=A0A931MX24_9HYPH|nr:branched-chain amino acid ABC transporter permease [Methylobrevis albus]MBH0236407.1 branched-chain amino acid ABC transporter permease [Methylobrevis albus]